MKRIIYSTVTKVIAAVLFVTSVVYGVLVFTNCGIEYNDSGYMYVYGFERSFNDTKIFSGLLSAPEDALWNAVVNAYYDYDAITEDTRMENYGEEDTDVYSDGNTEDYGAKDYDNIDAVNTKEIAYAIERELSSPYYADKIDYYIRYGDIVLTNCGAQDEYELTEARFHSIVTREGGLINRDYVPRESRNVPYLLEHLDRYDNSSDIAISVSVKESYVFECEVIWQRQANIVREAAPELLACVLLALASFVYLICVCGRDKHGEVKGIWIDSVWTEVHLAAIAGCGIGAIALWIFLIEEYSYLSFSVDLLNVIVGATAALASAVILTSILSIVRNIKCKNFLAATLIFRLVKLIFKVLAVVLKWLVKALCWLGRRLGSCVRTLVFALSKWTGVVLVGLLVVYTALIGLICIFAVGWYEPAMLILALLVFVLATVAVAYRSRDVDEIKRGVSEIRGGNVSYKIPEPRSIDLKALASNVNDIAKGLDESVAAKVKAERLKTELITNVSHDLKTPITSIISYAQLLCETEGLSEEAMDYVQVISKKGERLKNLTQDLFDISKVQSGNEDVVLEKLDAAMLINQSLGEHDAEISQSGLSFVVDAPRELYFSADGRKMSRVLSNLISNILKYSMKNTRVFITAREVNDEIMMELKNISCYPMEFSADEIVGRFVRGDESRSAEGNGLGLAIVKSYTELCGGEFEIVTDGDMFKAIIKFKKYS